MTKNCSNNLNNEKFYKNSEKFFFVDLDWLHLSFGMHLANRNVVTLSESRIENMNSTRKRRNSTNPATWKDNKAKISRNLGEPYQTRHGVLKPGKIGPIQVFYSFIVLLQCMIA
jgi:hypothetical protein